MNRTFVPARPSRIVKPMAAVLGTVVLTLSAAACGGGSTPAPVTPAAPTSATSTPAPPPANALSGRPGRNGRVLVVKLDNTDNARPHAGLSVADVVYLEEVEWGLTRYVAVFSSKPPKVVGPIRSARITDLELLAQYGKVAFAFSGSQARLKPVIARANLFNVSGDAGPAGYYRDFSRPAPYNFFGNGPELLARAPHAVHAHDVGFRFANKRPAVGLHVSSATVRWPAAKAVFCSRLATSSLLAFFNRSHSSQVNTWSPNARSARA